MMRAAASRLLLAARSRAQGSAAAVAASRRLALAVFVAALAPAEASGVFTDGAGLKAAVGEWEADQTSAEAAHGPIAGWDVSRVDNFDCEWVSHSRGGLVSPECVDKVGMFSSNFNGDVSNWDTSSATTMTGTFWNAAAFNRPLAWDTSKLTTMESTFRGTSGAFNPELPYCSDYCNGNVVENDLSCGYPSSGCSPACYKSECVKCCGCASYYV